MTTSPDFVVADQLSERFGRLVQEVISRLPPHWNLVKGKRPRAVIIVETAEPPSEPTVLAHTELIDRRTKAKYRVTLYSRNLLEESDDLVLWTIAHELGHVATLRLVKYPIEDFVEKLADVIAIKWGFGEERKAWESWSEPRK